MLRLPNVGKLWELKLSTHRIPKMALVRAGSLPATNGDGHIVNDKALVKIDISSHGRGWMLTKQGVYNFSSTSPVISIIINEHFRYPLSLFLILLQSTFA
jgi:hypothetical protein